MSRYVSSDTTSAVDIPTRAVVSRMIFSDNRFEVHGLWLRRRSWVERATGISRGHCARHKRPTRVHRRRRETRCGTEVLTPHGAGNAAQYQRARTDGHALYACRCGVKRVVAVPGHARSRPTLKKQNCTLG
jgi:hypothetical protein